MAAVAAVTAVAAAAAAFSMAMEELQFYICHWHGLLLAPLLRDSVRSGEGNN